jgi:hypothetical protein
LAGFEDEDDDDEAGLPDEAFASLASTSIG